MAVFHKPGALLYPCCSHRKPISKALRQRLYELSQSVWIGTATATTGSSWEPPPPSPPLPLLPLLVSALHALLVACILIFCRVFSVALQTAEPRAIFVHTEDGDTWGVYSSQAEIRAVEACLNKKGVREKGLLAGLARAREHIDGTVITLA